MLSARTFFHPRRRAWLPVAIVAGIALLPIIWYLASPLVLTRLAAGILRLPDGRRLLRLEDDFRVTNGPGLYVYLSGDVAPRSSDQLHPLGAFEVGQLKGNVGGQNHELPTDLDLSGFRSVGVYCRRFTTVCSTAELRS